MHNDRGAGLIAAAVLSRSAVPDFDAPDLPAVTRWVGGPRWAGGYRWAGGSRWWGPRRFVGAGIVGVGLVGAGAYYGGYGGYGGGYGGGCRQWQVVPTPWGPQWRLVSVCYAPVGYGVWLTATASGPIRSVSTAAFNLNATRTATHVDPPGIARRVF